MNYASFSSPPLLSEIVGVSDARSADWRAVVCNVAPGNGLLPLGCVVTLDPVKGNVSPVLASTYADLYGILLETLDTGTDPASPDAFTATVARAGSFYAPPLTVGAGADLKACASQLRLLGIYLEAIAYWSPGGGYVPMAASAEAPAGVPVEPAKATT
jgi:hypothetical protein